MPCCGTVSYLPTTGSNLVAFVSHDSTTLPPAGAASPLRSAVGLGDPYLSIPRRPGPSPQRWFSKVGGMERQLGQSDVTVPALGVGTNRWGGGAVDAETLQKAYRAALDAGVGFFDTAEIYTRGRSELAVGKAARDDGRPVVLATKFAPFPYRLTGAQFSRALDRSLERLGVERVDLYYIHFPYSPVGPAPWIRELGRAVNAGKVRAAGVSNFSAAQMRKAVQILARHGIPLAANQVQYSLTHRKPEHDGVLQACRELDVALVAYRPIAGGGLGATRSGTQLAEVLGEIANDHGATATHVALAWLLRRDDHVIAIPGSTKPKHVADNAAALAVELSDDEFAAIDRASA